MVKISALKVDREKAEHGVELEYKGTGGFVTLARMNNSEMRKYMDEALLPFVKAHRDGNVPREIRDKITKKAVAHTVVKKIRGFEDDDGNELEYSGGLILEWFNDPTLSDFYDWCVLNSSSFALYRAEAHEDAKGNSSESSAG